MILERVQVPDGSWRFISPDGKYALRTHLESTDCFENGCCLHFPTPTVVENVEGWKYNWRTDRGIMERICEHGVGHPDFDSANFLTRMGHPYENVHGCDFCCSL